MKKPVKITLISLLSLLGVLLVAICLVLWLVLTPARMTPIVNKIVANNINCNTNFEKVDVTFFSTFPHVSLHVKNVDLVNPMQGAPSDTLARIQEVVAALNVRKFLKEDSLELKNIQLKGGTASLYVRSDSCSNFDIFSADTTEDTSSTFPFAGISAEKVSIDDLNVSYLDETMNMLAKIAGMNARLKASLTENDMWANVKMDIQNLFLKMEDSSSLLADVRQLELHLKGDKKGDDVFGNLQLKLPQVILSMDSLNLLDTSDLRLELPVKYQMADRKLHLDDARLQLDEIALKLTGDVSADTSFSVFDCAVQYDVSEMAVSDLIPWIDKFSPDLLEGIELSGRMALAGEVNGRYDEQDMPLVSAQLNLNEACLEMEETLPAPLTDLDLEVETVVDLNQMEATELEVKSLSTRFRSSAINIKGKISDLFNEIICQLHIGGDIKLADAALFVPDDMDIKLKGGLKPNLDASFTLEEIQNFDLQKIKANGLLSFQSLQVDYDSILIYSEKADLNLNLPSKSKNKSFKELLQAEIKTSGLQLQIIEGPAVETADAKIKVALSNVMDTTRLPSVHCDFDFSSLSAVMDTIIVSISNPKGDFLMLPSKKDPFSPAITCGYRHSSLSARMGSFLRAVTRNMSFSGNVVYDSTQEMILDQWNPKLNISLDESYVVVEGLDNQVDIPDFQLYFTPEKCDIKKGEIALGQSEFNLSGLITNIGAFLRDEGMMKGNLKLESDYVDVNYLMDLFSGMNIGGDPDTVVVAETAGEDDPFMVPLGMDVTLETRVKSLLVGETIVDNLAGQLSVKDGTLILEEMGFTSDAAQMQLTALYKSPRKNNLFVYLDFHLLDISIADMIEMIPDIDTIVPMLKTFAGNAEFHLAAQTNLKSNYDIKYSTLRGAMSIHGNDLVVLDNETFNTISKYLMFKKKTENKVDSIDVEMTVFQREVELYPFRIAIDKYQALVSGRYIIKENYDCHLSLVKSPLPVKLGLKVYGSPDKMKFRLEKPKYSHLYKPEKRNVTEEEVIKLKQMITNSLRANVRQ